MSGFNVAELMPFYLDETDEHIAGLNDALLRLEQDPADAKALQEAFRFFHSIKGSSVIMGFVPVSQLTHHLESLYDQLRSKKRTLDRSTLDLTFRCLDELRDYHRDLRARARAKSSCRGRSRESSSISRQTTASPAAPSEAPAAAIAAAALARRIGRDRRRRDLPAQSSARRHEGPAGAEPAVEQSADSSRPIRRSNNSTRSNRSRDSRSILTSEADSAELRSLADVEGVAAVRVEPIDAFGDEREDRPRADSEPEPPPPVAPSRAIARYRDSSQSGRRLPSFERCEACRASGARARHADRACGCRDRRARGRRQATTSGKPKIAETIRVDSDRLDHLMNLAGELVITKARFIAISIGLEKLFKSSNAHTLTSDTRERLESISRGLEGLSEIKNSSSGHGSGAMVGSSAAAARQFSHASRTSWMSSAKRASSSKRSRRRFTAWAGFPTACRKGCSTPAWCRSARCSSGSGGSFAT